MVESRWRISWVGLMVVVVVVVLGFLVLMFGFATN
jgi:hypothetical protein